MSELWERVEADLDGILRSHGGDLDTAPGAPDGLPPVGTWIRAVYLDDDLKPKPETPWHWFAGWRVYGRWETYMTRCRTMRPGRALDDALDRYIGQPSAYSEPRRRLEVELRRPRRRVCRKCSVALERDESRRAEAAAAGRLAELSAALPTLEAIATDRTIDDAERGRRLRDAWPT